MAPSAVRLCYLVLPSIEDSISEDEARRLSYSIPVYRSSKGETFKFARVVWSQWLTRCCTHNIVYQADIGRPLDVCVLPKELLAIPCKDKRDKGNVKPVDRPRYLWMLPLFCRHTGKQGKLQEALRRGARNEVSDE